MIVFTPLAITSPGLHLLDRETFDQYWRSKFYSHTANGVMSRPVIAVGSGNP